VLTGRVGARRTQEATGRTATAGTGPDRPGSPRSEHGDGRVELGLTQIRVYGSALLEAPIINARFGVMGIDGIAADGGHVGFQPLPFLRAPDNR
jgi:hypothetical protein